MTAPTLTEEKKVWRRRRALIGVDEVGVGPFAGPVLAVACVLFPYRKSLARELVALGVKDSKKIAPAKREIIFHILKSHPSVLFAQSRVYPKTIDRVNVFRAGHTAMQRAVEKLMEAIPFPPSRQPHVYIDGKFTIKPLALAQTACIGGDNRIFSIACASIIAKVTRDRLMRTYAKRFPEYQFEKHKGYGTKLHRALIAQHGPSPIHRRSFLKGFS